eukprot:scaffold647987_cov44-Prasinocladus_malaysianus.AAC.1
MLSNLSANARLMSFAHAEIFANWLLVKNYTTVSADASESASDCQQSSTRVKLPCATNVYIRLRIT